MIKRVNFTGRKRIPRDRVHIEILDGTPRRMSSTIDFTTLTFPPHAAVFLEAMCAGSNVVERIDCGDIGSPAIITDYPLTLIEGENVFFTLKVVDRSERYGRILGIAENIRPERSGKQTASGRRGILPIEPKDLGEELWRLEFKENDVFLLVHSGVPNLVERARCDPLFYAVVYPEVVRRILTEAFRQNAELDDDDDRWPSMWLRFGRALHPGKENPPLGEHQEDEQIDWIEDVVKHFCDDHQMKTKFAYASGASEGGES